MAKLMTEMKLENCLIEDIQFSKKPFAVLLTLNDGRYLLIYLQAPVICPLLFRKRPSLPWLHAEIADTCKNSFIKHVKCRTGERVIVFSLSGSSVDTMIIELYGHIPGIVLATKNRPIKALPDRKLTADYNISTSLSLTEAPQSLPVMERIENQTELSLYLARRFLPGSPMLFRHALVSSHIQNSEQLMPNWSAFLKNINTLQKETSAFALIAQVPGKHSTFMPFHPRADEGFELIKAKNLEHASYLAWKNDLDAFELTRLVEQRKRTLLSEINKNKNAIIQFEERLSDYENEQLWRREADALLAWRNKQRGHTQIELPDPYNNGYMTIQLDPTKTPQEEATERYNRAKRASKGRDITIQLLKKHREMLAKLQKQLDDLLEGREVSDGDILSSRKPSKNTVQGMESKNKKESRSAAHSFTSTDGLTILVGKGALENEEITFKVARGEDIWLHARERGGAHVIVRLRKGESIPPITLKEAAELAAYFSKGRNDSLVEVIYTQRKYVLRRKNMPRGAVIVSQEKTILVHPRLLTTTENSL